jgi:hypothetical protein
MMPDGNIIVISLDSFIAGTHELLEYMDFVGSIIQNDLCDLVVGEEHPSEITLCLCSAYLAIDQHLGFLREEIAKCRVSENGDIIISTSQLKEMKFLAEATDRSFKALERFNISVQQGVN